MSTISTVNFNMSDKEIENYIDYKFQEVKSANSIDNKIKILIDLLNYVTNEGFDYLNSHTSLKNCIIDNCYYLQSFGFDNPELNEAFTNTLQKLDVSSDHSSYESVSKDDDDDDDEEDGDNYPQSYIHFSYQSVSDDEDDEDY